MPAVPALWIGLEVRHSRDNRLCFITLPASRLMPTEERVEQLRQGIFDIFIEPPECFHQYVQEHRIPALP